MSDAINPGEVAELIEDFEAWAPAMDVGAARLGAGDLATAFKIAAARMRQGASLLRALNERERVLVEAASNLMTLVEPMVRGNTDFSVTWRKYVREMRAALTKAQP